MTFCPMSFLALDQVWDIREVTNSPQLWCPKKIYDICIGMRDKNDDI